MSYVHGMPLKPLAATIFLRRSAAFVVMVLLALVSAHSHAFPAGATSEALAKAVRRGRFSEAVRTYLDLEKPSADDEYFVGFSLMALNCPEKASSHLEAAKSLGWSRRKHWPSVESLLDRVADVRRLSPPLLTPNLDPAIQIYMGPATAWRDSLLRAVPDFAAVGRRIFGSDLPHVRLYLIPDRKSYDLFFRAMFGCEPFTSWHNATGGYNVILFCEHGSREDKAHQVGDPDPISRVLHELGHAWCHTYMMNRYNRPWPSPGRRHPWLDEGIANVIASLREPGFLQRRAAWLKANSSFIAAPTLLELQFADDFYREKDAYARYCVATVLTSELVGSRETAPARIRAILDELGKKGPLETALRVATEKDLRTEFDRVIARFWD